MEDWQVQLCFFHSQLDIFHMRRYFDLVYLFDVPQLHGENIVMNRQSKEISENIKQRIGVVLNNERLPKAS